MSNTQVIIGKPDDNIPERFEAAYRELLAISPKLKPAQGRIPDIHQIGRWFCEPSDSPHTARSGSNANAARHARRRTKSPAELGRNHMDRGPFDSAAFARMAVEGGGY